MTPAAVAKRNRTRVLLAFGAVYFLWGSTFLAIKYSIDTIPPFLMGGSRFLIAGAVLYAVARLRGAPRPSASDWRTAAITGVLMIACGNGAVVWSEQSVPSGIVALIVATVPLWMVMIDWLRPRGVRPRPPVFVGLALGIVGIVILVGPKAVVGQGHVGAIGAGILVLGSLSWAAGSIITRRSERPSSALVTTALQMLAGGVALAIMSVGFGELSAFSLSGVSLRSLLGWLYLIVFGSLIGFTAYVYLLGTVSAAKASTYAYVNPVIAVLLGWAFANEPVGARTIVAAAVILAGVAIITTTQSSGGRSTGEHPVPSEKGERARSAA
jgi:drug/metabolite transporter (DMT)-like permease